MCADAARLDPAECRTRRRRMHPWAVAMTIMRHPAELIAGGSSPRAPKSATRHTPRCNPLLRVHLLCVK